MAGGLLVVDPALRPRAASPTAAPDEDLTEDADRARHGFPRSATVAVGFFDPGLP